MKILPSRISEDLIESYKREYDELCCNWMSLEKKAQLSAGYAGAILMGGLAFLGSGLFEVAKIANWAFPFIAAGLLISVFCSLKALCVSDETLPPAGEDLRQLALKYKAEDEDEWVEIYARESTHMKVVEWEQACKDIAESLRRKGNWITRAQRYLFYTAIVVFVLVVVLSFMALKPT